MLLDHDGLGRYASTRNQSWLHSGALYSIILGEKQKRGEMEGVEGLKRTAQQCRKAFKEVVKRFAGSLELTSECLFLFKTREEAEHAHLKLHELDPALRTRILNRKEIGAREPLLAPATHVRYGVATEDIPFDSHRILSGLVHDALFSGGEIYFSNVALADLAISREQDRWVVDDGKRRITARVIIAAAGAHIPKMRGLLNDPIVESAVQYCLVAVLHQRLCNRIIVVRAKDSGFLNVVPFDGGTTVNLGSQDRFDSKDLGPKLRKVIAEKLTYFVPGLRGMSCQAHFYVCEKLSNAASSSHPSHEYGFRHYFWEVGKDKFFYFYPGKFTLAPLAAQEFVRFLRSEKQLEPLNLNITTMGFPTVVPRPYFESATDILRLADDGVLDFCEIQG